MSSEFENLREPEEDDPTSSSENESWSESDKEVPVASTSTISQARAPALKPSRPRTVALTNRGNVVGQSRKVLKARDAHLKAWQALNSILTIRTPDNSPTPWADLIQAIPEIVGLSCDSKVTQCRGLRRSAALLWPVIRHQISEVPDSSTKHAFHTKSLSRPEAKAHIRFLRLWRTVNDHISELPSGLVKEDIVSLKCDVLLRIAKFVLEVDQPLTGHPTTLDLSNFKHAETPSADTPLALKAFQVELSDVQSIDLSRNDLLECPNWLFGISPEPTPFPNLTHLDFSDNPRLSVLPLRVFRNPTQYLNLEGTLSYQGPELQRPNWWVDVSPEETWDDEPPYQNPPKVAFEKTPSPNSTPIVPGTLLKCSVAALIRADYNISSYHEIPPHLASILNESYVCDLCHTVCTPSSPGWLHRYSTGPVTQVFLYRGVLLAGEGLQAQGRSCGRCLGHDTVIRIGWIAAEGRVDPGEFTTTPPNARIYM